MFDIDRVYKDRRGIYVPEYYVYTIPFIGITGAAPALTNTIQTQSDASFVICRMNYFFIDNAAATETVTVATQEIPDVLLQLTDSGSSKNFYFSPVPIDSVASLNNVNDVWLPVPREIAAGSSLTGAISSTKTFVNTYRLNLQLIGFKKLRISPN